MIKYILCLFLFVCISCGGDDEMPTPTISTTIAPNIGVGDIHFTDDGNAVIDLHGDYDNITSVGGPDGHSFVLWYDNGLAFVLNKIDVGNLSLQEIVNMANDLVDLNQPIIQIIVRSPFDGETTEGIKLGSTRAEVVGVYGEPDQLISSAENYNDLNLYFSYSSVDSTLTRIDLNN